MASFTSLLDFASVPGLLYSPSSSRPENEYSLSTWITQYKCGTSVFQYIETLFNKLVATWSDLGNYMIKHDDINH